MKQEKSVVVRPLEESDKEEWTRMWRAYLAYYETTRPPKIYDVYFERLLGNNPQDYNGLLAEVQGRPVGLAHFLFHRHGWSIENTCYLQDLYADPDVRGKGIGRALIEAVDAAAGVAGVQSVYWLTQDFNTTARRLYDRVGVQTPFIKYTRR